MFQFHTITDDERARMQSQSAIMVSADARAVGMVTARKANGGRKYPRTHASEHTSDCVVTTANGDRYTIKRPQGNRNSVRRAKGLTVDQINAMDKRRKVFHASEFAPVGNID